MLGASNPVIKAEGESIFCPPPSHSAYAKHCRKRLGAPVAHSASHPTDLMTTALPFQLALQCNGRRPSELAQGSPNPAVSQMS